ncbi:hypothetical protein PG994_006194 [Apiospora phragmitis]|uniref:Mitochondrial outer membrane protein n=1 Tax=Apiospora phragmitis TaxID=2905665 RepID=A0ABR1VEF9_9PEZI
MSQSPAAAAAAAAAAPGPATTTSSMHTPAPAAPHRTAPRSSWFTIPEPLRLVFNQFPLVTYAPNELPVRSPFNRDLPVLYVFASDQGALKGLPSYNPSCLKWQTFLKLAGVQFRIAPSSNHASPTGALPFLIPPSSPTDAASQKPIPSSKLERYALERGPEKLADAAGSKLDAYQALLDSRIRNAWLYALYLSPGNSSLLSQLYVEPCSASMVVRTTILHKLRRAAEAESAPYGSIYRCGAGFRGTLAALGPDEWFFGSSQPGLFDAAVFAYTHLLLEDSLEWIDTRLQDSLLKYPALVEHRKKLFSRCWGQANE